MACVLLFSFIFMLTINSTIIGQKNLETYIVHVSLPADPHSSKLEDLESWYYSFLPVNPTTGLNDASRMVYSYRKVVSGFAARLSAEEVKEMEEKKGFLSARPEALLALQTTHSPDFLGLHKQIGGWSDANQGKGVIIGVIDTGITPDHPSFSDEDMPPPPPEWKGRCEYGNPPCNNKLIGLRSFIRDRPGLPFDEVGHGTHTASTAAGNFVANANVYDNANGTAVGMAPHAHLAIYSACSRHGCRSADVLAAIDAAVLEGVHVLSLSLGFDFPISLFEDEIAIGAFGAIRNRVFVSCSAGNYGPLYQSLRNGAPWILTVGASTTDRDVRATAVLGNNQEFDGQSFFQPKDFQTTLLPLVYPGMNGDQFAATCEKGSLDNIDVKAKIVLCDGFGVETGETVRDAGGAAMILMNQQSSGYTTSAEGHVLPAAQVSFADGQAIKAYINSTSTPKATIQFKGTIIGVKDAPAVAAFSSRGPNHASPGILKPDIIGPGVNILAAWSESVEDKTTTKSNFNVISGTSMACPHLSGIAALIKNAHPRWSPAAIKSAIMTTANFTNVTSSPIIDERRVPADIFMIGAGQVNASRALDPGLVYDIQPNDYIPYLCGLGYSDQNVRTIVGKPVTCSTVSSIPEAQLNYPSFAIQLPQNTTQRYSRIVTNVGIAVSSYHVEIEEIPGVEVSVQPEVLNFTELDQQMTYQITFRRTTMSSNKSFFVQGAITWISEHRVRSPIAVLLAEDTSYDKEFIALEQSEQVTNTV
ncbi:subtilisin-like protease SBT1.2 [Coffea eugenioides]|uniref:subtilisin-like protease SBT1.2 n=1 Tax=Coffea eugenioides TaxID=49369 RepID=UPI000F6098A9|nr:subtilisin-like protease SBT1.2 [Coffea eugenioides]